MNFLKNMDLYQAIILFSAVLLPAGGWWVSSLQGEIELCQEALDDATERGGLLEEIGELQKKIEVVAQNQRTTSDSIADPSQYFQDQIMTVSSDLKANDFTPGSPQKRSVGRKKSLRDFEVDINWGKARSGVPVKMDFIYAVLFNCESGARRGLTSSSPSVWRLRKLHIQNSAYKEFFARSKTPAPELEDKWRITAMTFARREPVGKK
jgi:hypothetical protein